MSTVAGPPECLAVRRAGDRVPTGLLKRLRRPRRPDGRPFRRIAGGAHRADNAHGCGGAARHSRECAAHCRPWNSRDSSLRCQRRRRAGALITGYYLVSQLGITTSLRLAAVINLLVRAIAWAWPTRPATVAALTAEGVDATARGPALSMRGRHLVLAACAVSGFVGLALEIIWFRALVMFLAATTYVFTLILAIVLGGIATGSALATRWLRRDRDWIRRLAILQIAIAVTAVASLAAQAWTFSRGWRTGAALQASALSVLPTMLLMGAAFPIALYCWTAGRGDSDTHTGDRVGRFYL